MKNYLDPVYLLVNNDTWKSRLYDLIFISLNDSLNYIEEVEQECNSPDLLVKFKFSEELHSLIYSYNPFINDPEIETSNSKDLSLKEIS